MICPTLEKTLGPLPLCELDTKEKPNVYLRDDVER